jgi:isoleucyl-tRNA synthetase
MEKNQQIEDAVSANLDYIKSETLTKSLIFEEKIENGIEIEFDDLQTKIFISK